MEIGYFQEHIEFDVLPGEALMSIKAHAADPPPKAAVGG